MKIFGRELTEFEAKPEIIIIEEYVDIFHKWLDIEKGVDEETYYALEKHQNLLPNTQERIQSVLNMATSKEKIQDFLESIGEEDFTYVTSRYSDCLGGFISYCVDNVYPEDKIELILPSDINALGTLTRKNWIIHGNAGDFVGIGMQEGLIEVNGDAGKYVADGMEGGEIHLNGNYKRIGSMSTEITGGEIYHKGKLIYKNGKRVGGFSI